MSGNDFLDAIFHTFQAGEDLDDPSASQAEILALLIDPDEFRYPRADFFFDNEDSNAIYTRWILPAITQDHTLYAGIAAGAHMMVRGTDGLMHPVYFYKDGISTKLDMKTIAQLVPLRFERINEELAKAAKAVVDARERFDVDRRLIDMQHIVSQLEKRVNPIKDMQIRNLQDRNDRQARDISNQQSEIRQLRSQNDQLNERISTVTSERDKLANQLREAQETIRVGREQFAELKRISRVNENRDIRIKEVTDDALRNAILLEEVSEERQALAEGKHTIIVQKDREVRKALKQAHKTRGENRKLRADIETLHSTCETLEKQRASLEAHNTILQRENVLLTDGHFLGVARKEEKKVADGQSVTLNASRSLPYEVQVVHEEDALDGGSDQGGAQNTIATTTEEVFDNRSVSFVVEAGAVVNVTINQ